ncbi:MAG: hypothetical protein WD046_14110 [Paracoccaceae bacterium]
MTEASRFVLDNLQSRGWFAPEPGFFGDNDAAYAAQDAALGELAGARGGIGGYKIAYNSAAQLAALGQSVPGAAYVCAGQIVKSGARLVAADYDNLMIEPEIGAVLGQDLVPDKTYMAADMAALVVRWVPVFELLDRRNSDGHFHVPSVLAHNIFNEGAVVGGPGLATLPDLAELQSVVFDNGSRLHDAAGSAPQDPAEAAAFLANHFSRRGQIMKAGAVLLCGTHMPIYKPETGHELRFELGALGAVSFSFASA